METKLADAIERVQNYLGEYAKSRQLHKEDIASMHAGHEREVVLKVSDLRTLASACNSHEQLVAAQGLMVEALKYAKMRLELADEDRFDKSTLRLINHALQVAGAA